MDNREKLKLRQVFSAHLRCIREMNRYVPGRIPAVFLHSGFRALSPYAVIWFSARLINELAGMRRAEELRKWAILTVAVTAALGLLGAVLERWIAYTQSIHNDRKNMIFTDKFLSMDFSAVDDQQNRDLRSQVHQNENFSGWGFNQGIVDLEMLIQAVLGILGAAALTVSLFSGKASGLSEILNSPVWAAVILGMMFALAWFSAAMSDLNDRKWIELASTGTQVNRLFQYYGNIRNEQRRQPDFRIYGQYRIMEKALQNNPFNPGQPIDRTLKGIYQWMACAAKGCSAFFIGLVYLFVCMKAAGGAFGIGSVTQYVGAVTAMYESIQLLLSCINECRNNTPFLNLIFQFLDIPNTMYQGSLTTEKRSDRQYEVEFRDVSFRYPGAESWALRKVSMKFKVGSRLAIVGENGSGKTTFIKLLCRLYDPQEGEILLNGIDIRKYNYRDYMNIFAVVFQDFQLLSQPLGANVAGCCEYDRERVLAALKDAGFEDRLKELPRGLDTFLYRDFSEDGIEVSGGEAQKIAIARALYKDAPFIILDEPTAALDPIAEAEIYARFNDIAGDKTAVYISHRLSSCKFCDEIAVFHEGRIIQQGTHEELLAEENGKYHELWNAQAQYYTQKE